MSPSKRYSAPVRHAAELLGTQIREGRINREWTIRELAERASVSPTTVVKVERGDPSVAIGSAFDLAVLVGVSLFFEDEARLAAETSRAREHVALLPRRVRPSAEPDYDF